ncbi:hypothetical protein NUW54_g999 [Trametes sanguinea]|uniref:Uncharacterized protein n=1 Tax=Trametes sanguinea TaxID=158606 RepID=A0ACC1Q7U1_9APHY|nr:hypothetical protein NUW54_g999 [Trametes sanguinea]
MRRESGRYDVRASKAAKRVQEFGESVSGAGRGSYRTVSFQSYFTKSRADERHPIARRRLRRCAFLLPCVCHSPSLEERKILSGRSGRKKLMTPSSACFPRSASQSVHDHWRASRARRKDRRTSVLDVGGSTRLGAEVQSDIHTGTGVQRATSGSALARRHTLDAARGDRGATWVHRQEGTRAGGTSRSYPQVATGIGLCPPTTAVLNARAPCAAGERERVMCGRRLWTAAAAGVVGARSSTCADEVGRVRHPECGGGLSAERALCF